MLRRENTDMAEMLDSYKAKLHAKTVEFNKAKKKLDLFEKGKSDPAKKDKNELSAIDELLQSEKRLNLPKDERRVILLKAQNTTLTKKVQVYRDIINRDKKLMKHC